MMDAVSLNWLKFKSLWFFYLYFQTAPHIPQFNQSSQGPPHAFVSDPRDDLFNSIKKGKALKPVVKQDEQPAPISDPRNDLLAAIRDGIKLKPSSEKNQNEKTICTSSGKIDALANALNIALAERSLTVRFSESEEDDDDFSDDWEEYIVLLLIYHIDTLVFTPNLFYKGKAKKKGKISLKTENSLNVAFVCSITSLIDKFLQSLCIT